MSAETTRAVRWPLPAGPWREGWDALGRADAVIVTRKRATPEAAQALARRARGPGAAVRWPWPTSASAPSRGWSAEPAVPADTLAGKRVVAASGIADPDAFVAQTKATGAAVQVATWKDHHDYRDEDVAWLAHAARRADHVVITQKDAVKLRDRWPAAVPEPLVALLDLTLGRGRRRPSSPCWTPSSPPWTDCNSSSEQPGHLYEHRRAAPLSSHPPGEGHLPQRGESVRGDDVPLRLRGRSG